MEAAKVVSFHSYENLLSYTNKIRDSVNNIKNEYIYIGALLNEVNNFKLYEYKGYKNISDFCENEFGFKKSFTYNLMNVQHRFCDKKGSMFSIDPKFKDYDFSKLVLMCKMDDKLLLNCKPDYTVEQIKNVKKGLYPYQPEKSTRMEKSVQTENSVDCSDCYSFDFRVLDDEDLEMLDLFFDYRVEKGSKFKVLFIPIEDKKKCQKTEIE